MATVSIITPLYNKKSYVTATIEAVQSQTMCDWEMIVVENGSTDGGNEVVTAAACADARVRLLECTKRGPGAARNAGLARALGEWVLFLDADDLLEPDYLAEQLRAASQAPAAGIIVSGMKKFREGCESRLVLQVPAWRGKSLDVLRNGAISSAPWIVHAALVRRSILFDVAWPEELDRHLGEDIHFWFKVLDLAQVSFSRTDGAVYRYHVPGCRTQDGNFRAWYTGIDAAISANVAYLLSQGRTPNAGQCEALTRCYSGFYQAARRGRVKEIAEDALGKAGTWERRWCELDAKPNWRSRVRRLIGVRLASWLVAVRKPSSDDGC